MIQYAYIFIVLTIAPGCITVHVLSEDGTPSTVVLGFRERELETVEGGRGIEIQTKGLALRAHRYDPGISIGSHTCTYLYANGTNPPADNHNHGTDDITITAETIEPAALVIKSLGFDIRRTSISLGGYRRFEIRVPSENNTWQSVTYSSNGVILSSLTIKVDP